MYLMKYCFYCRLFNKKTMWKSTIDDDLKIPISTPEAQVDITTLIDITITNDTTAVNYLNCSFINLL